MNANLIDLPPGATPYTLICAHCGTPIESHVQADDLLDPLTKALIERIARLKMLCRTCHAEWTEKRAKEQRHSRAIQWRSYCPAAFRDTQKHRLPSPTKLDRVLQWKFGAKGMLMTGPTGQGKSRCAWKLVEREFFLGRDVEVMDANFGMMFAQKYSVSGAAAYDWLEQKAKADILLMDDVFKVKLTDAAEGAIFNVVNARCESGAPIIVTLQDNAESLKQRMTADRGEALIRRLREFCEVISF